MHDAPGLRCTDFPLKVRTECVKMSRFCLGLETPVKVLCFFLWKVCLSPVYFKAKNALEEKRGNAFTFTFSHLADAFIQSDLQLGST